MPFQDNEGIGTFFIIMLGLCIAVLILILKG